MQLQKCSSALICILGLFLTNSVLADAYSCAKMVYKDGWLTNYEYLGNTWGANTKKNGVSGSTIGSTVEKTTSSVDPGAYTGKYVSSTQYSSSWGECSMLEYHITKQFREDYLEQNKLEVKKQIALGEGHHLDSLAYLSGCSGIDRQEWTQALQKNTSVIYDAQDGRAMAGQIEQIIRNHSQLDKNCQLRAA